MAPPGKDRVQQKDMNIVSEIGAAVMAGMIHGKKSCLFHLTALCMRRSARTLSTSAGRVACGLIT